MNKKEKDKLTILAEQIVKDNEMKTYSDFSELFDDLQGKVMQTLLEGELDLHLGYKKGSHNDKTDNNRRNGHCKPKEIKTKNGKFIVQTPRDRNATFTPIIIPKNQTMLDSFEDIAISLYAKGMSLRDMEKIFNDVYKFKIDKTQLSYLISKVNNEITKWQNRALKKIYAFMYIDCLYVPIKKELTSEKDAVYVMIGIDLTGHKEVIGIWIGNGAESTSKWTGILEEIKIRGIEDILFISIDGLSGLEEAINKQFPQTIVQRCIVHLTRNLYDICNKKNAKEVIKDYKTIYKSSNLEEAQLNYDNFMNKYSSKESITKKVSDNIEYIYQIMEYPQEIRKLMYTTNAVESVNSAIRKVTRGKGAFPSKESVLKIVYLRIKELQDKWNKPVLNWDKIIIQLSILFEDRISKYL